MKVLQQRSLTYKQTPPPLMSGVQSCSRTMTVMHQRSLTPPTLSSPIVCLSRSIRLGNQNPLMNVPRSPKVLSKQVSVKATRQASLYLLKKVVLARNSSILLSETGHWPRSWIAKGPCVNFFRSLCRTPPFIPRLGKRLL